MGFAATSVLFLSVLYSRFHKQCLGTPATHQDSRATTAVKDFMLAGGKSNV